MQYDDDVTRILDRDARPNPFRTWPGEERAELVGKRRLRRGFWQELRRWFVVLLVFAVAASGMLVAGVFIAVYRDARLNQTRPVDAIVLLGAAQYNGTPSPVLRARLDEALAAFHDGASKWIVVTGGKMPGDQFTEAEASRDYLVAHGVPKDHILMENVGRDTWDSLQGAAVILRAHHFKSVLLVSDGFHLFRSKLMMRELGFTSYGRAATKSPIRPNSHSEINYMVRETGGVLVFLWNEKL